MQQWRKDLNAALGAARAAQAAGDYNAAINYANQAASVAKTSATATAATNLRQAIYEQAGPGFGPGASMGGDFGARTNDNPGGGGSNVPAPARVVSTYTRRNYGGKVETVRVWSDGREEVINTESDRSAGDAAVEMFRMAGLDERFVSQLAGLIDSVYQQNISPNSSQILNVIYNSDAYKTRFAGNEMIRKRIADGSGRPGDRLLSPKEYIDAENTYRTILQDSGMPEGFYDSPEDFNNLIGNGVSAAEFKSRVDTANEALNFADENTVNALRQFYGLSRGDLVSYLLDPTRATPIFEGRQMTGPFGMNNRQELQKMYEASKVGGAAARQGLDAGQALSEEIVNLGQSGKADEAFAQAGAAQGDLKRLGSLYGEAMDFKDLVKESLNLSGGVESGRKRRKFSSKERAAFGGQGALDKSSLSRAQDV